MSAYRLLTRLSVVLFLLSIGHTAGHAQSPELSKKVGRILFTGDITDEDAKDLRQIIYREMDVADQVTKECDSVVAASTSMLIGIKKGNIGAHNMNKIVEGAENCANSGQTKGKRKSISRLPPLPRFHSPAWRKGRKKFHNSYYAIKTMRSSRGEYLGWPQAQRACWRDHRGRLVTIESRREDTFVAGLVKEHGTAYIGIWRKWRMGGKAKPRWIRHTASGKDSNVSPYRNWLDGEPSTTLANADQFNAMLGYWGIYDKERPAFWQLWKSSDRLGWRTVHPGALIKFPVSVGICEWDKREWIGVQNVKQLSRNRLFNTMGGVARIDGNRFRF